MFCEYCGVKIEDNAQFCQGCGKKVNILNASDKAKKDSKKIECKSVFYSENWRRQNVLAFASLPYFDLMIDEEYLYLIKLPQYSGANLGLIFGLILLNIVGAIIGDWIGSSSDSKKRKYYKSIWLNSEKQLISDEYIQDVFLKIPLSQLKSSVTMKKNRIILTYNNQKVVLSKDKKNFEQFNKYIEKYVL